MYKSERNKETGEIVLLKNNEILFGMIPVEIKPEISVYGIRDRVIKNPNFPQYIVIGKNRYKSVVNRLNNSIPFYYDEAIGYYNPDAFKQYTQEVFDYIADYIESKNDKNQSGKDYGVEDEFTYAYIMAHTEPENHKYLRFYNWDTIKGENKGWASLTNWKKDLKLPKQAKTKKTEY